MIHGIEVWFGLTNASGPAYLAWSGILADISELAIVGALLGMLRKHQCHIRRCLRFGHYPVEGTPHVVCRNHHPMLTSQAPTIEQVHRDWNRAVEREGNK